jgi:hypothetical protein
MKTKVICLLLATLLFSSCLLFPRTRLDVLLYDSVDPTSTWSLGSVEVERNTMDLEISRTVPEILVALAHSYQLPLADRREPGRLELDISISEREFTRNLDTLNSIAYTATLRDRDSGKQLAQAIYSEESRQTIASFYHLHAISEKVIKNLSARLARQAKKVS